MVNKENILFATVGLLAGLIIGFMFANSMNQKAYLNPGTAVPGMGALPAGHPSVGTGGSVPEVQEAIDRARSQPDDFDSQIKAAEMYYQIQRFEGAVEFLERASKLRPDDLDTTINLANAYFDSGKYDDASKIYATALEKRPDDVNLRTDLGLTFVFRPEPDYDRAIAEFNKALEKDASHIQALQNLTVAHTKKGDSARANETLAKLEKADPLNTAIPKLREDIGKIGQK
jgi:tetratricopeptide (TPR) repeat protein